MCLSALKKLTVSVLSANFKKMEVLPFFSQLHQAFSFEIVVWDSKLLRHSNWGKLGPFKTTKNKDRSKNVNCALFPFIYKHNSIQQNRTCKCLSLYSTKEFTLLINPYGLFQ